MRNKTDAVVIGGGALGASIFYYLTKLGMKDVVLIEKGELASGSTGDSAAFIRQHYSNDVSIQLVKKALNFFRDSAMNFPVIMYLLILDGFFWFLMMQQMFLIPT